MENNMKLLIDLYNIPAKSNHEKEITEAVKKMFIERGCKVKNKNGNLYITKGKADTYPCIAAHLDEVHDRRGIYTAIYSPENDIIYGWSFSQNNFCGIGADDKNGIWVALQMVERLDYCKVALFRGEEIGCVGSQVAWMQFFEDCRFVLQVDRRNAGDLITDISGCMVSDEFMKAIDPIAQRFGYKETHGLMTDVEALCEQGVGISCVNMSCGYYNPHTENEFTKWSELLNTLAFVEQICIRMTDVYKHEYEPSRNYGTYSPGRVVYNGREFLDDWYYDISQSQPQPKKEKKTKIREDYAFDLVAEDIYNYMLDDPFFVDDSAEANYEYYQDMISKEDFLRAWDQAKSWVLEDMNREPCCVA